MTNACLSHSDSARIAADYDRSEALGRALLEGLDIPVQEVGSTFAYSGEWVRKVNLVTGEVVEGWVYK